MKIYAYFLEDERLYSVKSCEDSKFTDQEIVERVKDMNEKAGREAYKLYDVPEEMEEVIRFLLGEKKYKRYADIDDLDNSINELDNSVKNSYETLYDLAAEMDWLKGEFEKFKDKLEEKKDSD